MRPLWLVLALVLGMAAPAMAQCVVNTYVLDGRIVVCTTCCTGSMCNTSCQ